MEMFDVVIVGAGVAGALIADALVEKKHKVLVLEAGPENQNRGQLLERYYSDPNKGSASPYPNHPEAPKPGRGRDYYVQKGKAAFASFYERRVGGTTWHWQGLTPRFMPSDFRMLSQYGVGIDWPISYEDLEPWYLAAEHQLGVAGDNSIDFGSPRSGDYAYPSQAQSLLDLEMGKALKGHKFRNVEVEVKPHRAARNPNVCQGSSSCMPICPTGAKYEAVVHVNKARNKGAVIRAQSVANRVAIGDNGLVSKIHYKTWDGQEHTVEGKYFVLAAHAIEIPKLLLMSSMDGQRNVANSSDQVGRNLMDHPLQVSVASASQNIGAYRGPQSTSVIMTFRDKPTRKTEGGFRVEIFNAGHELFGAPNQAIRRMIESNLIGKDLQKAIRDSASKELLLVGETEQLPDPENRVTLSTEHRDALNLPHPEIYYSHDPYSLRGIETLKQFHQFMFEKMQATNIFHVPRVLGSGHIMGTTRMGNDPKTSVVDANLQCHDHQNLFIASSGVFPTGATANPTLTIAALSLRLANYVNNRLKTG